MNKKIYTLFAVLISLLMINVVKAAGPYNKDFETPLSGTYYPEEQTQYKDGYLFQDYDEENERCLLSYYKANGEKIKSVNSECYYYLNVNGENIYAEYEVYNEDEDDYYSFFRVLNSNFEIINTVPLEWDEELPDSQLPSYIVNSRDYFESRPIFDGDKVVLVDYNGKVTVFSKDLKNKTTHQITEAEIKKYFPDMSIISYVMGTTTPRNYIIGGDHKDGYYVLLRSIVIDNCQPSTPPTPGKYLEQPNNEPSVECMNFKMGLYDDKHNLKWEKEYDLDGIPQEARFANDYIIVVLTGVEKDSKTGKYYQKQGNKIVVYDMKGNKVQEINSDLGFNYITPTTKGFIVTQNSCFGMIKGMIFESIPVPHEQLRSPLEAIIGDKLNPEKGSSCESNHQVYSLELKIETKVTKGKGTVTAVKSSKPGEPVTFTVTPAEGYVLGEVRVTDANGKTIVFKQNTFTMPNADVMIEAVFLPANPETKDIAIISILLISVISGGLFALYRKRLKEIS